MKSIILISTQLTGTQQTIAKWTLLISIGLWIGLKILVKFRGLGKFRGKDE